MKKEKVVITKETSRALLLSNLSQENKNTNVYITFKYMINKEKLKKFQKNQKKDDNFI